MLKWVEETAQAARGVLPPLGPSAGVTELGSPINLLWVSAQYSA
jgi:hypothetical protein